MGFENLPVVYAGLTRRPGVYDEKAFIDLFSRNWHRFTGDSSWSHVNRIHSAVKCGIVVLTTGWNPDDLRFDILSDCAYFFFAELASREPGQSRGCGDHQRRRAC